MTHREKLVEWIKEIKETCRQVDCDDCEYKVVHGDCQAYLIADHLISKGVTNPLRCGECKYWTQVH